MLWIYQWHEYFLPLFFFLSWSCEFSQQQRSCNIWERQVVVEVATPLLLLFCFAHISICYQLGKSPRTFSETIKNLKEQCVHFTPGWLWLKFMIRRKGRQSEFFSWGSEMMKSCIFSSKLCIKISYLLQILPGLSIYRSAGTVQVPLLPEAK